MLADEPVQRVEIGSQVNIIHPAIMPKKVAARNSSIGVLMLFSSFKLDTLVSKILGFRDFESPLCTIAVTISMRLPQHQLMDPL